MEIFISLVLWFLLFTLKGFSTLKILGVILLLFILVFFSFPLSAYFESTEREIVSVFPNSGIRARLVRGELLSCVIQDGGNCYS